jgi:hypothetical protein
LATLKLSAKQTFNERKWREFIIEDLFDHLQNSKAYHKTNLHEAKIGIAYISRTNLNNGLEATVANDGFKSNPKNSIVFGAENAAFFYEPFEFITGNKMYIIADKRLNKYNGLFIQKMLNTSIKDCGFGYGKGLTGTRMKKRSVRLPVDNADEPDWEYMERYMKALEGRQLSRYIAYLRYRNISSSPNVVE